MAKYICTVCGFVYDEAKGIPDAGIAAEGSGFSVRAGMDLSLIHI